jgi:hypothetical protein
MSFFARLLGKECKHYFSWPRTDNDGRYYQICSRCGIAYEYDWVSMRRTDRLMMPEVAGATAPVSIPKAQVTARMPLVR